MAPGVDTIDLFIIPANAIVTSVVLQNDAINPSATTAQLQVGTSAVGGSFIGLTDIKAAAVVYAGAAGASTGFIIGPDNVWCRAAYSFSTGTALKGTRFFVFMEWLIWNAFSEI